MSVDDSNVNATHVAMATLHAEDDDDLLAVSLGTLAVAILSPAIVITNGLILCALRRFKKLRTPSNYLVGSLAASDFGLGVVAPAAIYLEVSTSHVCARSAVCLLPFGAVVTLGAASVLAMAAIAVDRFTSLAQPLRYNNIITHRSMERYVAALWIYALIVGAVPLSATLAGAGVHDEPWPRCSWSSAVVRAPGAVTALACAAYAPAALALLACYGYIYVIARRHARAIHVEQVLRAQPSGSASRYGCTLALTVGLFVGAWAPFLALMLSDAWRGTRHLHGWTAIFAALPVFATSAANPWMYGFRNTELSGCVLRVLETLVGCPDIRRGAHDEFAAHTSCASHLHLCAVSTNRTTLVLLPARNDTCAVDAVGAAETSLSPRDTIVRLTVT